MTRNGFALPAAIVALVLLSALIAGALFVSTEELRAGRTDIADQHALALAEAALEQAIVTWDTQRNTALVVGASVVLAQRSDPAGNQVQVVATRVQPRAVWLTARASSPTHGNVAPARHTVAASMRLVAPDIPLVAALTARGRVIVGNGTVDGRASAATASLACADDTTTADAAGIALPDTAGMTVAGVFGTPPLAVQASLTSEPPAAPRRSDVVLASGAYAPRPVVVAGKCDARDPLNWGDPAGGACGTHYVVIHITGDATLRPGSVGQGILVVDGTLRLEAGAHFDGVVMAGNDIDVAGADARITGAAVAHDRDGADASRVSDGATILFNRCTVHRAQLGVARLERTPGRWWAELR